MRLQFTIFVVITISTLSETQRPSPCPEIFHYESQSRDEENKWYGAITLNTDEDLFGVWVKITLDRKAELLGVSHHPSSRISIISEATGMASES